MKASNRRFIAAIAAVTIYAATAAAQAVVVVGTGDPDRDVPAVQASVDEGGQVVLMGHFSFDREPTVTAGAAFGRMVLVSKGVVISGTLDEQGEMTTIAGGIVPFAVEAPGASVTIRALRFVRPKEGAIWTNAVSGLVIADCKIEGVEPLLDPADTANSPVPIARAIRVNTSLNSPTTGQPGQPQDISGTVSIFNNDIDLAATANTNTIALGFDTVGKSPDQDVDIYVSGNNIRNSTGRLILLLQIGGRAHIERNVLTTGAIMMPSGGVVGSFVEAIKFQSSGSYLIAHNSIDCGFANGAAIRGLDQAGRPEAGAIVVDNDVNMSAPDGTVFGTESAGIEIRGLAQRNAVLNNRIRGRASFALSVFARGDAAPVSNTFVSNDIEGFQSSRADVFVGQGVTNTVVIGTQSTVEDHGIGTLIVPRAF